jgi:anti-sigma regulatory factor (Ser/Thr protein kinase)
VREMHMNVTRSEMAAVEARDALHAWMFDAGCSEAVIADALIIVSELVTNAVMHADSDSVVIAVLDDMRLRLEVHDRDPSGPVAGEPTSAGGFGLAIVAALADSWGWESTRYGKRVWTETLC